MKTDLSLQDLAKQITERAARKADFVVPSNQLRAELHTEDDKAVEMTLAVHGQQPFKVTEHAHGQIAGHLDIPAKYYNRMLSTAPELLTNNINEWLGRKSGERRMIRALDGSARAFLSDKFARLDDDAFAETVLPIIADVAGSQVDSCSITETNTHIKFTSKTLVRDVKVGDTIQFGIAFSNSEVGAGSLQASLFTQRLICLNGMISSDEVFRTTHVGQRVGGRDLSKIFRLDTVQADGRATILKLRDYARDLLSDRVIDGHIEKLRELTGIEIKKPTEAVEKLAKAHGLADSERESVLEHLIRGADLSAFGLAQAVTRTAEDARSYERATELERIGGKLVSNGKTTVREFALAA